MRFTFRDTLISLAEKDPTVYLLVGDLGFAALEEFSEKFPGRFINCGVSEQNMIGISAGLALSGKKPYVYSIIPFITMRCLEHIRNDICYQNLDIKIIGVGSGFAYGSLGATHHALEDIAVMRSLCNMTVLCPADPVETEQLLLTSYQTNNPTYIRLGRGKEKILYTSKPDLTIGKPVILAEGDEGVIIATGTQVASCLEAAKKLKALGRRFTLLSMHTVKPIDKEALLKELKNMPSVFTVEEHNITGGLGSAVAEILLESGWKGHFQRVGVPDEFAYKIGSQEYLQKKYGLDSDSLVKLIEEQTRR